MDTITFDKLLLETAFCCMAADGKIDKREVSIIKSLCKELSFFENIDIHSEINQLVKNINTRGKEFVQHYLDLLKQTQLTQQQELTLIDFATKTISADEQIEYSEIKFFKNIRHRLQVSNEEVLKHFPEIEEYLEEDIITGNLFDIITNQDFDASELPQFELITINTSKEEE